MKKKFLTYAGVAAAALLVILFAAILLTGTFSFFPSASINPVADWNTGDLLVVSGTTNLPVGSQLVLGVLPASGTDTGTGAGTDAVVVRGSGMTNTWSAAVDTTGFIPGEYQVQVSEMIFNVTDGNVSTGNALATSPLRLASPSGPSLGTRGDRANQTPFIAVNAIGTKRTGEKFIVSGTTNLLADTYLLSAVIQQDNTSTFSIDPKTREMIVRGGATVTGLISVLPGTEGINRWSFGVDTASLIPGPYIVNVSTIRGNASDGNIAPGDLYGSTGFTLVDTSAPATQSVPGINDTPFITVDTPGVRPVFGERVTITGTTNLPAGNDIMVQITPSFTSDYSLVIDPRTGSAGGFFSGAMANVEVVPGTGGINLWSLTLDTASLRPSKYDVNASTFSKDPATGKILYGNVSGTAQFTLEDKSP